MYQDAREIVEQIISSISDRTNDLTLDYYRTQEDLDAILLPATDEPVGYVNARTRLIGQILEAREIHYSYRYRK